MILERQDMIQNFEAKQLEALIYGVLQNYFSNPVFGATTT